MDDIDPEPIVPESITYCITKTRFCYNEPLEHPDAMLRNVRTIALSNDTSEKQQSNFIEAVNWMEYRDILTYQ